MEEYLVPYLAIGGNRETFWKLTPETIKYDFKAYDIKREREEYLAWLHGAYVKQALQSTILMCGLADRSTPSKMPKYPERPLTSRHEERQTLSQEERTKLWVKKMDKLMAHINSQNKGGL